MLPNFFKTLTCIRAIKHTLSFSALATELTEQNIQSHPKGGNRSMQQTSCIVSLRFHKQLFSKAVHPAKKPQLAAWRRPLMISQQKDKQGGVLTDNHSLPCCYKLLK